MITSMLRAIFSARNRIKTAISKENLCPKAKLDVGPAWNPNTAIFEYKPRVYALYPDVPGRPLHARKTPSICQSGQDIACNKDWLRVKKTGSYAMQTADLIRIGMTR